MNILLLGNTGQLGWELERSLAPLGQVQALDYPVFNLAQPDQVLKIIQQSRPQVIVNATAYTAVDKAESEPELAVMINGTGPGLLAEAAKAQQAAFIHYSTDFVFDGYKDTPYVETDTTNPLGVYGRTKLDGEHAVQQVDGSYLILRTSWVYSLRRDSIVIRILRWARQQTTLRLVTDQVRNPTWCRMLAEATALVLAQSRNDPVGWLSERRGIYHLAGAGQASMLEWGKAILEADPRREEQIVTELLPSQTSEFPTPARRPLYSVLNCELFAQTFDLRLPDWRTALRMAMETGCP
jgi:dTDP-4-dehydrorhamnose reductase